MKKADLAYPAKPKKDNPECLDNSGNPDLDAFEMAVFAWKEDYKSMKYWMERYKGKESNAWALIHDQCSPELKNKLEGTEGYDDCKAHKQCGKAPHYDQGILLPV